ncbi:MAG: GspH/FimT family pseudopilin [Verrucomicrobiales bacterium]|jgi:prepilin-type N-terminal cleavage/methylation domain-containing protein|nr:GspH/FimT family pseudopilin [Verrucomicrobiales bacterium]
MVESGEFGSIRSRAVRSARWGFTLIELLCVVGIIGIIGSMALMSVKGVEGRRLVNNTYELADLLRSARATAIAQNAYVAIGFNDDRSNSSPSITIATFISKNGQSISSSTSDYQLLSKLVVLKDVKFAAVGGYLNSQKFPDIDTINNTDVSDLTIRLEVSVSGNNQNFTRAIVFNPHGELMQGDTPVRCLGIGLQFAKTFSDDNDTDEQRLGALQISGLSGNISVFLQ